MRYDSSIEVLRAAAEKYEKQIGFEKSTIARARQDGENAMRALEFLERELDKLNVTIAHLQFEDQEASV
jgi:hypothetical protein